MPVAQNGESEPKQEWSSVWGRAGGGAGRLITYEGIGHVSYCPRTAKQIQEESRQNELWFSICISMIILIIDASV